MIATRAMRNQAGHLEMSRITTKFTHSNVLKAPSATDTQLARRKGVRSHGNALLRPGPYTMPYSIMSRDFWRRTKALLCKLVQPCDAIISCAYILAACQNSNATATLLRHTCRQTHRDGPSPLSVLAKCGAPKKYALSLADNQKGIAGTPATAPAINLRAVTGSCSRRSRMLSKEGLADSTP